MEILRQNIRMGLRSLRNGRSFTVTAIVTLALGIGLATAVFTVADALILRRLPVTDQNRIVVVSGETPDHSLDNVPLTLDGAREFSRRSRALNVTAFFLYNGSTPIAIREGRRVSQLQLALVSGTYFTVLGARPLLGRALATADDEAGAAPVLVLSHRAWQEHFGGAPDVVGRQIVMHETGVAYRVVGVMPAGLDFPRATDIWVPVLSAIPPKSLQFLSLNVIGRLAAGASSADARNEMTAYFRRDGTSPWEHTVRGVVQLLPNLVLGDTRSAVFAFGLAAALLLVITCINVANLLLVRGLARVREFAVRTALGASRGRIIGQLLTEHALLAIGGGVLGVVVAALAVRGFVAAAPASLPRLEEIGLNATAVAAAFGITTVATLLFAVVPASMTSRIEAYESLRSGARQSGSRRSRILTDGLVAAQIALALLVLSAAGLIARSLMKLQRVDLAFDSSQLAIAQLSFRVDRYASAAQQGAALEQMIAAMEQIPGVQAVSPVVPVPYAAMRSWEGRPALEGQSKEEAARDPMIDIEVVAPSFFETLGLRVLRGRGFTAADRPGSALVVMLSESIARRYWNGAEPIGKRVVVGDHQLATVVGIVPDTRYRNLREAHATIYFPLRQSFYPFAPTTLVIRTTRGVADLAGVLRAAMADAAPGVGLVKITPFAQLLATPLSQPRMNALLLAVFAVAALALAGVGLFGVLATMVRQRTRELGVRMALGATPGNIARLVLGHGLLLAAIGTAFGLVGALGVNHLLVSLLFNVSPTDTLTLVSVAAGIFVVATAASIIPTRSSTQINPIVALRAE